MPHSSESDANSSRSTNVSKLVTNLVEGPLEKTRTAKSFSCHHITTLLVEFNTPILLSVGVKRLFSLVKQVIRPVRAGLSAWALAGGGGQGRAMVPPGSSYTSLKPPEFQKFFNF